MARSGRPRAPSDLVLGIDIGASKVIAGLVDGQGQVVAESDRRVHGNDGPAGVVRMVLDTIDDCVGPGRPAFVAAGVAVAAQVDAHRGIVLYAPNLRWSNLALGARLRRALRVPVVLENDVRAATWGEWRFGAGQGSKNLACLYVGTGIGGGVVVDGRLLSGEVGAAGEVGHLTVVAGGRRCHCPNRGCLEAYASGWAIGEIARAEIRQRPRAGSALVQRAGGVGRVTAMTVTGAARDGDPLALRLMADATEHVANGAVSIVNAFDPGLLLLGGGIVEGWPGIVDHVRSAVRARAQPPAARAVRVGPTRLGAHAPIVGVARLARSAVAASRRRR